MIENDEELVERLRKDFDAHISAKDQADHPKSSIDAMSHYNWAVFKEMLGQYLNAYVYIFGSRGARAELYAPDPQQKRMGLVMHAVAKGSLPERAVLWFSGQMNTFSFAEIVFGNESVERQPCVHMFPEAEHWVTSTCNRFFDECNKRASNAE